MDITWTPQRSLLPQEFDRVLILLIKQVRLPRKSLDPAPKSSDTHTHTQTNRYSNRRMHTLSACGQDQGRIAANRLKCYRWDALHHDAASASASGVQVPFWIEQSIIIKKVFFFVCGKPMGLLYPSRRRRRRRRNFKVSGKRVPIASKKDRRIIFVFCY